MRLSHNELKANVAAMDLNYRNASHFLLGNFMLLSSKQKPLIQQCPHSKTIHAMLLSSLNLIRAPLINCIPHWTEGSS